MGWLDRITDSMDMNLNKFQEVVKDMGDWCAVVRGVAHDLATEQQQNHYYRWEDETNTFNNTIYR